MATIIMDHDDPQTVRRMLSYLYTLDYSDERLPEDPVKTVIADPALPPHLRHKSQTKIVGEARSGRTSSGVEDEVQYDPKRLNNVLVYAVADKYDIPELKELAKRKFHALVKNEWTSIEFEAVRDAVFGTVPSQDMGLRSIMCQLCIHHFQDIVKDVRLRSVVLSSEELAHALLENAMREKDKDMELLDGALAKQMSLQDELLAAKGDVRLVLDQKEKAEVLQRKELAKAKAETQTAVFLQRKELANAKEETQKAVNQRNALLSRLNALVDNANGWEECRNCGDDFGSWIERLGSSDDPRFQLRCSNCRCRHDV